MKQTFYSNGKLLITGEYLVLDGAKAFALPTKYGQNLVVEEDQGQIIHWQSFDSDGSVWFDDVISFESIIKNERFEDSKAIKNTLIEILHIAYLMNSDFINSSKGYHIKTELTFPKKWGLGTSSTLINNIAQWLGIDPFELLKRSFGGSGYDIACAQNGSPISYQLVNDKPIIERVNFKPSFTNNMYFIYLNKKQNSKAAIASYYGKSASDSVALKTINGITESVIKAETFQDFISAIEKHEIELSAILELQTIKESLFPDFNGVIKSLGAWGGDFVLAVSIINPTKYFVDRGFDVIIPYDEMIL